MLRTFDGLRRHLPVWLQRRVFSALSGAQHDARERDPYQNVFRDFSHEVETLRKQASR
ncbi:hypothetical protein JM93_01575 [Roseibium hamelinense]|uniref:Uncharacterized protein n=1 Tax=Roseibium hamelinense TaxID=150831 RepID=A0A562T7C6_9HYPH|nr:hypothetical protein [Roseibium hamelinense]TWI89372.1 hypothetical protein JM93_01575 [Roseibium hamelinense]